MSSSNRTDNLNLSQFSSNDKPGWLSDYNADMKHIDDHVGAAAAGLAAHTADEGNPHGVTAGQVGAASAEELAETNSDVSDVKNNLETAKGELSITSSGLTAHTADRANPHGVTAAQVGAYAKEEVDKLTLAKNDYDEDDEVKRAGGISGFIEKELDRLEQKVLECVYPVGSIYASFVNIEPSAALGFGTWLPCFVGKSPLGVDEADGDFNISEKTGGSKKVALTNAMLPSHSHRISGISGTVGAAGAHTHTVSGTVGSAGSHSHSGPSHTHTIPTLSGTAHVSGEHSHRADTNNNLWTTLSSGGVAGAYLVSGSGGHASNVAWGTTSAGAHTHTVATTANTSGSSGTAVTGVSGAHDHTLNSASAASAGGHVHMITIADSTSDSVGGGEAHNNMHPYETAYFWKRTA